MAAPDHISSHERDVELAAEDALFAWDHQDTLGIGELEDAITRLRETLRTPAVVDENHNAALRLHKAAEHALPRYQSFLRDLARDLLHERGAVGGYWARLTARALLGIPTDEGGAK